MLKLGLTSQLCSNMALCSDTKALHDGFMSRKESDNVPTPENDQLPIAFNSASPKLLIGGSYTLRLCRSNTEGIHPASIRYFYGRSNGHLIYHFHSLQRQGLLCRFVAVGGTISWIANINSTTFAMRLTIDASCHFFQLLIEILG